MIKYLAVAALITMPTLAIAQSGPAPIAPQELVFKVTPDEANLISDGLQEMPLKKALPLLNKLRNQVAEQQKPVEAPKVEPAPKE
jgi:hypothetical protein